MFFNLTWNLNKLKKYLRWHAVAHDSVVEGLPLSGVEAQDFDVAADPGQQRRKRPVLLRPLSLTANVTSVATALNVVVLLVEVIVSLNKAMWMMLFISFPVTDQVTRFKWQFCSKS